MAIPFILLILAHSSFIFREISADACHRVHEVGAAYFSTNDATDTFIIASSIMSNGKLVFRRAVKTQGTGLTTSTGISADSVITAGNYLFVVNEGTNDISTFRINPKSPTEISFVSRVPSTGEVPVALAYSDKLGILCVINAGKLNGVACFAVSDSGLELLPKTVKSLQNWVFSTTPPAVGGFGTISDIGFTANVKLLCFTVKGDPPNSHPGIFGCFPVLENGQELGPVVINSPIGIFPFSFNLIPGTGLEQDNEQGIVFTDPGGLDPQYGLGLFKLQRNGTVKPGSVVQVGIPGNVASCWSVFSPGTKVLFTADSRAPAGLVSELEITTEALGATLVTQYALGGNPRDVRIGTIGDKEYLYVLNPNLGNSSGRGVDVLALNSGGAVRIQTLVPAETELGFQLSGSLQGLSIYEIMRRRVRMAD